MRIIFLGTPEFSVKCLDSLYHSNHEIVAVVTQPDKPSERGNKIEFSDVKKYALEHNLSLFQFPKISRDGIIDLKALNPDIMITAAYGQILSQEVIDIPKYGIINVHASLLPKYRGAAPIQWAIINGETETGVTIMKTEIGLDTGDIIDMVKVPITETDTSADLSNKLADAGSKLLLEVLKQYENNNVNFIKQEQINATVTTKLKKEDCIINWNKSSKEIKCLILGANPNPVARTYLNGELVKIYRAKLLEFQLADDFSTLEPGTILPISSAKRGVFVKTSDSVIEITEIQLPGSKIMTATSALNGRKININDKFSPLANKIDKMENYETTS